MYLRDGSAQTILRAATLRSVTVASRAIVALASTLFLPLLSLLLSFLGLLSLLLSFLSLLSCLATDAPQTTTVDLKVGVRLERGRPGVEPPPPPPPHTPLSLLDESYWAVTSKWLPCTAPGITGSVL